MAMARRFLAGFILAAFTLAASGCGCAHKEWGSGAVGGGLVGAAALGTAGGAIANNVHPPFKSQDSDRGAGIGIGIATGAILGALIGHCLFDPEPSTPAPPAPPPPAAPIAKKLVLRGVNFDFNKATLQPAGRPILDEAAEMLKANPDVNIEIRGYTDGVGSEGYNLRLSERRAQAVKAYLVSRGVPASRLTTRGYGKSDPVATNETAVGRAQNRRVELIPQ
jgi:outer membrane protein OmpA-like peptidoglycan-associated protein